MTRLDSVLGSRVVAATASRTTRGRLRVLAFHDIKDGTAFGSMLDMIGGRFNTVTGADVIAWLYEGVDLPCDPVWITFDDGYTSVVTTGLELLAARDMRATVFVCAGLVGTEDMYWWEVVDRAMGHGLVASGVAGGAGEPGSKDRVMAFLKDCPDSVRRATVDDLAAQLANLGDTAGEQISRTELSRWLAAGNEVGNHSWDHPCLDRCDPVEQDRQVRRAHEVLTAMIGRQPDVFAWPNGVAASDARTTIQELGYRLVLRFDHRLLGRHPDPFAISRLRVDSSADPARLEAILSGAHSTTYHWTRRMRRVDNRADAR